MHDMQHDDLHSVRAKLAYTDTQLKVSKYAMKQNSDILWYPTENVDTKSPKKLVHIYQTTSSSYLELWLSVKTEKLQLYLLSAYLAWDLYIKVKMSLSWENLPLKFGDQVRFKLACSAIDSSILEFSNSNVV